MIRKTMNKKWIQVGYGLGITLILTGILYFFASNWQGFERHTKLLLSGSILLLFYLCIFVFSTYFHHQTFFIRTLWIAASISFGFSLALIGQLYNSHADHYLLFLVWLIPTLLLSIFIRHQSFYILSYVLFHLSIYFYFFSPSSGFVEKESLFLLYGTIGLINLGFFWGFKRKWMVSSILMYISLAFSHLLFVLMTISDTFGVWGVIANIAYLFLFVSQFYFYYKKEYHINILSLLSVFAAFFLLMKGIELVDQFFALGFLFLLLLFVSLLLFGGIKLTNLLKKHNGHSPLKHVIIASITFLCSILLTIAIIGIISLIMGDIAYFVLFLFSIAFLLIPSFLYDGWNNTLRFTLIITGYLISICSIVFDSSYFLYYLVLFAVLLFGYFKLPSSGMKVVQYVLFNGILILFLFNHVTDNEKLVIGILGIVNVIISSKFFTSYRPRSIQQTSFLLFMSSFFIMTRFDSNSLVYLLIINGMFFFTLITLLFSESKKKRKTEFWISISFGIIYLFALYYGYAWNLFNKSFVFMIFGVLLFIVSFYYDEHKIQTKQLSFTRKNTVILFIIFLQFGIIGTQIVTNEHLLQTGTKINLSLLPVDPRSLMQGDYVQLNYKISRIDELQYHEFKPNEHIKVVLRANKKGIYEYSGYYFAKGKWNKPYKRQSTDVIINGKSNGWTSVSYGIEHYFIPEKTGEEVERKAKYATVRVAKNGNALITSLKPQLK